MQKQSPLLRLWNWEVTSRGLLRAILSAYRRSVMIPYFAAAQILIGLIQENGTQDFIFTGMACPGRISLRPFSTLFAPSMSHRATFSILKYPGAAFGEASPQNALGDRRDSSGQLKQIIVDQVESMEPLAHLCFRR